ncbi:MAG: thioredoxin domain-containing protein [Candidatus Anstonellaceae archaeon]
MSSDGENGAGKGKTIDQHYVIGIAVILAALLVSATVYVSFSSLSDSLGAIKLAAAAGGAPAAAVAQQPRAQPQQAAPPQAQAPLSAGSIKLDGLPYKGGADAKVTIVEYSDFQCPFCQRASPTVKQMLSEYGNKIKFYYKHFPLSFHQNAQKSAEAYECALEQGKQWEYHDKLFEKSQADGTGLNNADLKKYAVELGLDANAFNSCLDSGRMAGKVSADTAEGSQNGVSGTPAFFINGEAVVGAQPYSAFKQVIDRKLAEAG